MAKNLIKMIVRSFPIFMLCLLSILMISTNQIAAQTTAWLDGDPGSIWSRTPGFYKDGTNWYAIIHVKSNITRVRLAGDFTSGDAGAIDLIKTPDEVEHAVNRLAQSRIDRPGMACLRIDHGDCLPAVVLDRRDLHGFSPLYHFMPNANHWQSISALRNQ